MRAGCRARCVQDAEKGTYRMAGSDRAQIGHCRCSSCLVFSVWRTVCSTVQRLRIRRSPRFPKPLLCGARGASRDQDLNNLLPPRGYPPCPRESSWSWGAIILADVRLELTCVRGKLDNPVPRRRIPVDLCQSDVSTCTRRHPAWGLAHHSVRVVKVLAPSASHSVAT
jgi:hypothetical protein